MKFTIYTPVFSMIFYVLICIVYINIYIIHTRANTRFQSGAGVYIVNFNHFPPPLYRDPFFFPNFREARRADTSPRPEGPSHLGGVRGAVAPRKIF